MNQSSLVETGREGKAYNRVELSSKCPWVPCSDATVGCGRPACGWRAQLLISLRRKYCWRPPHNRGQRWKMTSRLCLMKSVSVSANSWLRAVFKPVSTRLVLRSGETLLDVATSYTSSAGPCPAKLASYLSPGS